jgi:hypothetical protein
MDDANAVLQAGNAQIVSHDMEKQSGHLCHLQGTTELGLVCSK